MQLKLVLTILALTLFTFSSGAQEVKTKIKADKGKYKEKDKIKTKDLPAWAIAHKYSGSDYVYFPDYYFFYKHSRGYVYWRDKKWQTSSSVPSYLLPVDLATARMEIIDEAKSHPEVFFKNYYDRYPAQKVAIEVPVPDPK
jgi:hypothetical protein